MRRLILAVLAVIALTGPNIPLQAAYGRCPETNVNIVEPPFQSPQQWMYDPDTVTVAAGTTVTWTNTGAVVHAITSDDGSSFDSGSVDPRATFTFTAETPGTFAYHCMFHPWMT